ncbi:hypothetical protein [Mycobacteroides abscessus]|uniref:hypothetical protein n=1 Tax=Mycobacteroides abscessus TaxID=36809 RepID=UPI0009A88426|nr:hypothetical protein [Mycobacteroides abscessus]SLJ13291.1 Uncharacterised protein [Mycobacteroides abscessus subsp. abscessus]
MSDEGDGWKTIGGVLTDSFVSGFHNYVENPAEMRRVAREEYDCAKPAFEFEPFFVELEARARATHPNQEWIKQEFG